MKSSLGAGTILQERYEIASPFGSAEGTAAYLANDQVSREQVLIWESSERFALRRRPPGAREYFQRDGKHYLALRMEGQSLGFMLTAAGRLKEMPAGLWLLQICRAIGYWHNREEGPLVCLRQGPLALSSFRTTGHDQVMIPAYASLSPAVEPELPADGYQFSAPETGDALSPRSDVYALGAMLYCLLAGKLAPEPEARIGAGARLAPLLNQVRLDQFPQIIAYSSVLDENREAVRDLAWERFWVQQDGVAVTEFQVANVDAAQDPLAMVVAIDISGSMKGEPLEKAKAAAANFVSRFDVADLVALIKFDDRIELVQDFTTDKNAVIAAIDALRSRNDTALYDVIAQSVERLSTLQGRRAVIVLTDGRDTASTKHKVNTAIATANGANIPVFVVGLNSPQFTPEIMAKIASETGGDYLLAPAPDALDALYQKIRGQLQNQYRIDWTSLHGPDQGMHTLHIGLDLGGGLEIWAEKTYRSP